MFEGIHEWSGSGWTDLQGSQEPNALAEDSQGRLWSVGDFPEGVRVNDGGVWRTVDSTGATCIRPDPSRPGAVWATGGWKMLRSDGVVDFSRTVEDYPELNPQSDFFTTVAPREDGRVWLGSNQGLFLVDPVTGGYSFLSPATSSLPAEVIAPRAVTPDGRVWFVFSESQVSPNAGLGWYDGTAMGVFYGPPDGAFRWSGLPHAQIADIEVRRLPDAYELWMSCLSRGLAVLRVPFTPTSAEGETIPAEFRLDQNYPNPFNPLTTVTFTVPAGAGGPTTLKVYDLLGREIATLADGERAAGEHRVVFDASRVSSGVYLYRLETAGHVETRRMMVLR